MQILFSSKGLAGIAWGSTFAMIWLWILDIVPISAPNVASFIFFAVIAMFASAISSPKKT